MVHSRKLSLAFILLSFLIELSILKSMFNYPTFSPFCLSLPIMIICSKSFEIFHIFNFWEYCFLLSFSINSCIASHSSSVLFCINEAYWIFSLQWIYLLIACCPGWIFLCHLLANSYILYQKFPVCSPPYTWKCHVWLNYTSSSSIFCSYSNKMHLVISIDRFTSTKFY